jgi:hypothetical protein
MTEETYEYRVVFDRNFDPVAGIDKDSTKGILAEVIKKHGKGWTYTEIVPLAALVAGEIQPQGFCYLFKRPQAQASSKEKSKRK